MKPLMIIMADELVYRFISTVIFCPSVCGHTGIGVNKRGDQTLPLPS